MKWRTGVGVLYLSPRGKLSKEISFCSRRCLRQYFWILGPVKGLRRLKACWLLVKLAPKACRYASASFWRQFNRDASPCDRHSDVNLVMQ